MISAIFRRGGDVSFVVEELKAVFDPRGGAWTNGKYVPSLLAAIGDIIEQHFIHIGFRPVGAGSGTDLEKTKEENQEVTGWAKLSPSISVRAADLPSMIYQEGCRVCRNCGHSTCS